MIVIALAAYNGERFLQDQIDSIRAQTVTDWKLLISDDRSTDGTWELLHRFAQQDRRIHVLPQPEQQLGVVSNFGRLAEHAQNSGAEYVAFCDQDDVWFSDKLEKQLDRMRSIESTPPAKQPVLIHTDSEVVDESLRTIATSHHRLNGQKQSYSNPLAHLLLHGDIQGCTIMMNMALLNFVTPIPPSAVLHDWWFGLCAAAIGRIGYHPEPTLRYRQHERNRIGARKKNLWSITGRLARRQQQWRNGMETFVKSINQSSALLARLEEHRLSGSPSGEIVKKYCHVLQQEASRIRRLHELRKMGIPEVHWMRKLVSYARVLQVQISDAGAVVGEPKFISS